MQLHRLGSHREGLTLEANVVGCISVKRRVRAPDAVEGKVISDASLGGRHRVVGMQLELFVLDRLPQPLDEHAVAPGAAPVHADLNLGSCARLSCVLTELCHALSLSDGFIRKLF